MGKRTDYRICPECGAALDPGERCDCQAEADKSDNAVGFEKRE